MNLKMFSPAIIFSLLVLTSKGQSSDSLQLSTVPFRDVTEAVGMKHPRSEQFGGATVADLDSDGNFDIIFTYHNKHPMRIYYGSKDGTFSMSPFSFFSDIHGVAVAPRTATTSDKIIAVSVGGGRGTNLRPPSLFLTSRKRSFRTITHELGFGVKSSRGRVPLFLDMSKRSVAGNRKNLGGADVLFINLLGETGPLTHFAYQNKKGRFNLKFVPGFGKINEERAIVTDVDNDMTMEVIQFSTFRIFKLVAPFQFRDVTRKVWPGFKDLRRSISAVVELDFNNDGLMDLYIARADSALITPRGPPSVSDFSDVLLMNRGGRYVDFSRSAEIPRQTQSMGVSAEDFNNDGFVDIVITTFRGPDIILLNRGNGKFKAFNPQVPKSSRTRGSNVIAVDYNLDGRVDFIVGQAWKKAFLGKYRLMKNVLPIRRFSHYLLVKVGNEPTRSCTALNALVTLHLPRGKKMVRRVGGRGAQAGGLSFLDTVHFGLGAFQKVARVTVKWTTGVLRERRGIRANQKVSFGVFN